MKHYFYNHEVQSSYEKRFAFLAMLRMLLGFAACSSRQFRSIVGTSNVSRTNMLSLASFNAKRGCFGQERRRKKTSSNMPCSKYVNVWKPITSPLYGVPPASWRAPTCICVTSLFALCKDNASTFAPYFLTDGSSLPLADTDGARASQKEGGNVPCTS
jgi:hypothetical protein